MRFERIGPLGILNWFHDDWLVSRLAMRLFFLATIIVLAVTPIVYGSVDPNQISLWSKLGWGILGVMGPVAIFFLLFGMWRYWLRVDDSGRWAKRFCFLVLLVGIWWWYALCLYCWIIYLPRTLRTNRGGIQPTTTSPEPPPQHTNITFTPGIFGKVLITGWIVVFGSMFLLLPLFLGRGKAPAWLPAPWIFLAISLALTFTSLAYGMTWLYRQGTRR